MQPGVLHSWGVAPGIVEAPGQAWQVARIDPWKELTLGVLATVFSGGPKNLEPLNLGRCGKFRRPWGLESLWHLGVPSSPPYKKEAEIPAAGDPFHHDDLEAVLRPTMYTT